MELTEKIKLAVQEGRYLVGISARMRLAERNVPLWQVETGLMDGTVVEVPGSKPNPWIVVDQVLIDGTIVVVVWAWLERSNQVKLVSVYFPDREET